MPGSHLNGGVRGGAQVRCRPQCGACCAAASISSPIPGMPVIDEISKRAGQRCIQLRSDHGCAIFSDPHRPAVCASLKPSPQMCGSTRSQAMSWLTRLELLTTPFKP